MFLTSSCILHNLIYEIIVLGARGFVMDIWKGSKVKSFSDFSKFNKSSPLYSRHVLRDTISFYDKKWPKMEYSHGKLTGFYVPPHTGMYTFLIKNDDVGRLYMSQSESAFNKVGFVYCHLSRSWSSMSVIIRLKLGYCYLFAILLIN